ncbi:LOW QUALITY PROTEIN: uncharacterized protein FYW35_009963 [Pterocles gutturalis]
MAWGQGDPWPARRHGGHADGRSDHGARCQPVPNLGDRPCRAEPPGFSRSSSSASSAEEPPRERRSPSGTPRDTFADTPWPDDPPGTPPGRRPPDPPEIKIQLERPPQNPVRLSPPLPMHPNIGGPIFGVPPLMSLRTGLIAPPSPGGGGAPASPPPICQEPKPSSPGQDLGGTPPKMGVSPPTDNLHHPKYPLGGGLMDHCPPPPHHISNGGPPKMERGSNPPPSKKKGGLNQIQVTPKVGVPLPPPPPFILREKSSRMGQMLEFWSGGGGGEFIFQPP